MTFYVFLSCCTRFPEQCPEVDNGEGDNGENTMP